MPEPGAPAGTASAERVPVKTAVAGTPAYERYIVGSFQVKIPVSTREAMLPAEETTLAILKARLEAMPTTDRWYPVLLRYIGQIAARVDGLGGNSQEIPPSLSGARGDTAAGTKCRTWGNIIAIVLAALVTSVGVLTGTLLKVVPLILAALLVIAAVTWTTRCHPKLCRWLRTFIAGAGLGAALLAVLLLLGITAPQLVAVLCVVIILVVLALSLGASKRCF